MENFLAISEHLLRFSPDALIVVNEKRQICFANETVHDLLGYKSQELIGQTLEVLLPERLRSRHVEHVSGFLHKPDNREMGARIADLTARRADGTEFPAGIRLAPFCIGEKLYTAAAIRDITESRQVYESMLAAREEADRANRAKSRFLATASHDLRQPLQAVHLLNASMLKMVSEGDLSRLLARQGEAIEGMARLLNGLLDISRLESGTIELKHDEVHLRDLLAELHSEFESLARVRDLAFSIEPVDVVLATDRVLLRQLLENLIGNAIKYTDRGGVSVQCSMSGGALVIEISDTGIGIPEEKIGRIFDEYYQVDVHGARRTGVGLGLAIVREVARLLGCSVKVSSIVGKGTQVRISVPEELFVAQPAPLEPAMVVSQTATNTTRPRLVLLEDNEAVRRATELFLRLEEFEIESVASAIEAEQLLSTPRGDEMLVADFHLDGPRTGLDVLHDLRRRTGVEIPAVIMSGDLPAVMRTIKEPIARCMFLSKPVDTVELVQALNTLGSTGA